MNALRSFPRLEFKDANKLRHALLSRTQLPTFDRALFEEYLFSPNAFPATGPVRIQDDELLKFRDDCVTATEEASTSGGDFKAEFDLAIGRQLSNWAPIAGSDFGVVAVWDFITLVLLPDLAIQRFDLPDDDQSDNRGARSRLSGGNRRHVLQRLWRRRAVFGSQIVEGRILTEDDYGSLLERKLTLEHRQLARKVAMKVANSGIQGSARRDYTRAVTRALVQMSGVVQFSDSDLQHLDYAVEHADSIARQGNSRSMTVEVNLPAVDAKAMPKARSR